MITVYWDLHDAVQLALRQWEGRGHFSAGDAATDVMAILQAWGPIDLGEAA